MATTIEKIVSKDPENRHSVDPRICVILEVDQEWITALAIPSPLGGQAQAVPQRDELLPKSEGSASQESGCRSSLPPVLKVEPLKLNKPATTLGDTVMRNANTGVEGTIDEEGFIMVKG